MDGPLAAPAALAGEGCGEQLQKLLTEQREAAALQAVEDAMRALELRDARRVTFFEPDRFTNF